jgi:hypothetical protein
MNARSKQNVAAPQLEKLRLPELQQRYTEVLGEPTRCPNRAYLIRRITEALAARVEPGPAPAPDESRPTATADDDQAAGGTDASDEAAPAPAAGASTPPGVPDLTHEQRALVEQRGRLKQMSVEELQALYVDVVGRPTGSSDIGYLIWKIREAAKGRIRVGPRLHTERPRQFGEVKTLPFRIGMRQLEALDAAWQTRGVKNRMEFMRRALGHYLEHVGASDAAALFSAMP